MTGTWHKIKGDRSGAQAYKVGSVQVASVFWDSSTPRDAPNKYRASLLLPGCSPVMLRFLDDAAAKVYVERVVTAWFGRCGVTI